jgi:polar amino acid transport system substrate-binding protein
LLDINFGFSYIQLTLKPVFIKKDGGAEMSKKVLSCLLFFTLVLGFLVIYACGRGPEEKAGKSILDQVIANKKLRVGFLPDYPPWGSRNPAGKYEGYDLDIAALLAEGLKVELELIPVEAPNRVPSVATGKVDVIIGCLTPTNERAKTIDFTIPYASAGIVPMVWANNTAIKTYKDLAGKKVSVARGSTPDMAIGKAVPTAQIMRFDTIADAFTALQTKKVEAFIEEDTFVFFTAQKDPRFRGVGQSFTEPELISFGARKGDQNWLNYLNNFLTNLRYSGKNAELYKKWFGVPPASMVMP